MPSEDAIKAQIAAALAKKKQQAAEPPKPEPKPVIKTEAAAAPEPVKTISEPASEPKIEIKPHPPAPATNEPVPTPPVTDTTLVFARQPIRFIAQNNTVYFAVTDVLPLSRTHEWNDKFTEFINNPKTKKDAEDLTRLITFKDENGSDKTHGATAANIVKIFHALELRVPGPLGRWLSEVSAAHKTKN